VTAAVTARPSGFSLRVPDSWYEFDIWRATRTGDLARLVDARIAQTPELAPGRARLLRLLREAAADAERNGAVFCAVMADPVEDAGHLVASVTVFQTGGAPDPAGNTVEAIAAQVTSVPNTDASPQWRQVEIVELPAGRAVRVRGVEMIARAGKPAAACVMMQTLIPLPGGAGVLNVVLSSPQPALADQLLDLFEVISATLSWPPADPHGGEPPTP